MTPSTKLVASKLAEILRERQLLAPEKIDALLQQSRSSGTSFEELLESQEIFGREEILLVLENHYFCPSIDVAKTKFTPELLKQIPKRVAWRHKVFPVAIDGNATVVAFAKPDDAKANDVVSHLLLREIKRTVALPSDLDRIIEEHYGRLEEESRTSEKQVAAAASEKPQLRGQTQADPHGGLVLDSLPSDPVGVAQFLIDRAADHGATDIHVEPHETELAVRFRIDGILQTVARLPKNSAAAVISRLKVQGQMDIAERRLPQDGRFSVNRSDSILDLRVSSLPSQFGEKIVLRLLHKNLSLLDLDALRMPNDVRRMHLDMLNNPLGFFLVTGPTGSGKTTTLYATLSSLDRGSLNVIALEDPIEYNLDGITQVQINEQAGLTFAAGLESTLRQDPDVILVGEIRNSETVEIACRAALTGHKVFSTLHTNDATQAITRLLDMGVVPYLITATLRGVLAQRLVRVICGGCAEEYTASETELAILGYPDKNKLFRGRGCDACAQTGYKGRMAIYEYFKLEENHHRLILDRASSYAIRHAAHRDGMKTMADYAKQAVVDGITSVAEIQRAVLSQSSKEQLCPGCKRVISIDFSVCPFCKRVIHENCPKCGVAVDPAWEACASCGHQIEREWERLYCMSCDAPMEGHWTKCPYCGGNAR